MKKTLLATAIVGALGASAAAQAATVYDQDGTRLDIYGRIAMGIAGGGPEFNDAGQEIDNGAEFVDVFSRLGLRMSQQVTSDLSAFGHLEWRFRADERRSDEAFRETRQSYIGLKSEQYGTVVGGNFDSFYNQFVSKPFDVYIDRGFEFAGHPIQSRGDSIGYYTPDLSGFTAFLQLKHYSERGQFERNQEPGFVLPEDGEYVSDKGAVVAAQGGVRYAEGPVTVAVGFVDDVVRGGGNGEMLYGVMGSYDITDQFTARLGYEGRDNSTEFGGGFDTVGLGGTFTTGPWAFNVDYYNIERDNDSNSKAWSAGAYYKVSSNFDVFAEVADGDAPSVDRDTTLGDLTDNVYWLTGARYHF